MRHLVAVGVLSLLLAGGAGMAGAGQAEKTCETVIDVATKSLSGDDLLNNAQLLVRLSVALQLTLTPGVAEEQFHAELDDTLRRIQVRGRKA